MTRRHWPSKLPPPYHRHAQREPTCPPPQPNARSRMPPRRGGATSVRSLCRSAAMPEASGSAGATAHLVYAAGLRPGAPRGRRWPRCSCWPAASSASRPGARGAYAVRPLLVPGIVLLWPLVLWRWAVLARRGRACAASPRAAHRLIWLLLAALLPPLLLAALALRQNGPTEAVQVRLGAMSARLVPVGWTPAKLAIDAAALAAVAAYLLAYLRLAPLLQTLTLPPDDDTLRMRAYGDCALLLLTFVLAIGPLARLDARLLPLCATAAISACSPACWRRRMCRPCSAGISPMPPCRPSRPCWRPTRGSSGRPSRSFRSGWPGSWCCWCWPPPAMISGSPSSARRCGRPCTWRSTAPMPPSCCTSAWARCATTTTPCSPCCSPRGWARCWCCTWRRPGANAGATLPSRRLPPSRPGSRPGRPPRCRKAAPSWCIRRAANR